MDVCILKLHILFLLTATSMNSICSLGAYLVGKRREVMPSLGQDRQEVQGLDLVAQHLPLWSDRRLEFGMAERGMPVASHILDVEAL